MSSRNMSFKTYLNFLEKHGNVFDNWKEKLVSHGVSEWIYQMVSHGVPRWLHQLLFDIRIWQYTSMPIKSNGTLEEYTQLQDIILLQDVISIEITSSDLLYHDIAYNLNGDALEHVKANPSIYIKQLHLSNVEEVIEYLVNDLLKNPDGSYNISNFKKIYWKHLCRNTTNAACNFLKELFDIYPNLIESSPELIYNYNPILYKVVYRCLNSLDLTLSKYYNINTDVLTAQINNPAFVLYVSQHVPTNYNYYLISQSNTAEAAAIITEKFAQSNIPVGGHAWRDIYRAKDELAWSTMVQSPYFAEFVLQHCQYVREYFDKATENPSPLMIDYIRESIDDNNTVYIDIYYVSIYHVWRNPNPYALSLLTEDKCILMSIMNKYHKPLVYSTPRYVLK